LAGKTTILPIIFENKHWLAVNKIPKLSVERSPYDEPTIESLVFDYLSQFYKNPYIGIIHRLDRVTTGVLLFAKRKSTLRKINTQFRERKIKKKYLAIFEKNPAKEKGTLTNFIWKDRKNKKGIISKTQIKGSVKGILTYELIGQNEHGFLLEVKPITGKFHQIRVQLSHIGCPILGDEKYGGTLFNSPHSVALHAWQLDLINPSDEQPIHLIAPIPTKDWWQGFEEILSQRS
jgi:23S rRNA pseudouridine1911/1915/1917 synthase